MIKIHYSQLYSVNIHEWIQSNKTLNLFHLTGLKKKTEKLCPGANPRNHGINTCNTDTIQACFPFTVSLHLVR